MEIKNNQLRDRAKCSDIVTDEEYKSFNDENTSIVEEFLENSAHLSKQSIKQYESALRIFLKFIKDKLNDKPIFDISKREFLKYMTMLQNRGLSSGGLKLKKSAVSSLVNYIETFVVEDDEKYKSFRNFTKGLPSITANKVYEKVKISKEEYDKVVDKLLKEEKYMQLCWWVIAFNTGARKGELLQFKSELHNYKIEEGKTSVDTHTIRGKGRGEEGKPLKYMLNKECLEYIKLWLENREYEHEFLFTTKYKGVVKQISSGWANMFCSNTLTPYFGRRINPHITRASSATYLMEQGVDIAKISKHVLHHESLEVSQRYLIRDDDEDKNSIYK